MLVVGIAVAEMKQQLDVGGHVVGEVDQDAREGLLRFVLAAAVARPVVAFEPREHRRRDVELDRDLIVRQARRDLVDLALERLVVDGIERRMQVVLQKKPDHRMRRHQIDLEAAMGRYLCPRA